MPSFESAAATFYQQMQSPTKNDFIGTLFPLVENQIRAYDFTQARMLLRVPFNSIVDSGDEIIDLTGRRYVLGDHDEQPAYRLHKAFYLTHNTTWERRAPLIDPVTKLPKGQAIPQVLGPIWVALETLQRETRDGTLNTFEDRKRVVTRHDLQLNDKVNGLIVKRLDKSLGVTIAEVE